MAPDLALTPLMTFINPRYGSFRAGRPLVMLKALESLSATGFYAGKFRCPPLYCSISRIIHHGRPFRWYSNLNHLKPPICAELRSYIQTTFPPFFPATATLVDVLQSHCHHRASLAQQQHVFGSSTIPLHLA